LLRQETKPSDKLKNTKAPALRTIESAAGETRSCLAASGRNPASLVPRSGVFQGGFKKPYAKSVVVMLFRCLLMKNNFLSAYEAKLAGLWREKFEKWRVAPALRRFFEWIEKGAYHAPFCYK
jgi:hypothetical protein